MRQIKCQQFVSLAAIDLHFNDVNHKSNNEIQHPILFVTSFGHPFFLETEGGRGEKRGGQCRHEWKLRRQQ